LCDGAARVYALSGGTWNLVGSPIFGNTGSFSALGSSVALSGDATTALVGGPGDNSAVGAAWVYAQQTLQVLPATNIDPSGNIVASGTPPGPFSPTSFSYNLSSNFGSTAQATLAAMKTNSVNTGCNQLNAFLNATQAQAGNGLSAAQAQQLTTAVNQIQTALACA
jgi:hypothetical protein